MWLVATHAFSTAVKAAPNCTGATHCSADDTWYCCGASECSFQKHCPNNIGLFDCSCEDTKPTWRPHNCPAADYCDADGTYYCCKPSAGCQGSQKCASNPNLEHCACVPDTTFKTERQALTAAQRVAIRSHPCLKVNARVPLDGWEACEAFLKLPLTTPVSTGCPHEWRVPRLYHAVGKDNTPPAAVVMNAAANPRFSLRYLGDAAAAEYVRRHCGDDAGKAYRCFIAPAYRADLYRYCALYAEGGVYLDTDLLLTVKLPEAVSMCSGASVGHDVPQGPQGALQSGSDGAAESETPPRPHHRANTVLPGVQMKLLAGPPKHPLFECMLGAIIRHVRMRFRSRWPMMISGPQLLHTCVTSLQVRRCCLRGRH